MPTEIKAIQCPKCGSTQKAEIRPGDFRCDSCGTEYFIDDGSVKFGPTPFRPVSSVKSTRLGIWSIATIVALIVGSIILIVIFAPSTTTSSGSVNRGYTWYAGWAGDLYVSMDKRPVLLTVGTKTFFDHSGKNADYVAFNDVRDGSVIAILPLPDAASMRDHPGGVAVDIREFANGDIFIIVEKAQLFRVRKTSYTVTEVTRTLFAGHQELADGVAKIEFIYPREGEGFKLITNDGKNYVYYPLKNELRTKLLEAGDGYYAKFAHADEKSAIGFSSPWNSDFPDVPAQLIAFRYKPDPYVTLVPELDHYSGGKWDDANILERERVASFRDFTPGRIYFDYGVLYFDDDYVLISYRLTAGKSAPRYVQLLNAQTAAILFTTRLDVLYAPTDCIRYADGFAIESVPDVYTVSLAGRLEKHTPLMYRHDNQ